MSASLPTPPRLRTPSRARISWAPTLAQSRPHTPQISPRRPAQRSALRLPPLRGILKPPAALPFEDCSYLEEEDREREHTPEPADPAASAGYLEWPLGELTREGAGLRELVRAYGVLGARLACARDDSASEAMPLLQPLRAQAPQLVSALVRDLGRVLEDPLADDSTSLPSPRPSPKGKKRGGMSEDQARRARDAVGAAHGAIKLLVLALSAPAVTACFDDDQLSEILTAVLALPLASCLPTPNARKTCALAVWLLGSMRLPASVLRPAATRIAYALRRATGGELGKEGKKGAVSDGLKAVHDLSIYAPDVFVSAFVDLLPGVLDAAARAPTLALRAQAAHALGGLAIASSRLPQCYTHTRLHDAVVFFLGLDDPDAEGEPVSASPTKSAASPTKSANTSPTKGTSTAMADSELVRAMRAALRLDRPAHPAQGPVWALSVLCSLITLLSSGLAASVPLMRLCASLAVLGTRSPRSTIRSLTMLVCRALSWAWHRPPLLSDESEEPYAEGQEIPLEQDDPLVETREATWRYVARATDMGAGIAAAGAALASAYADAPATRTRRVLGIVRTMVGKGGRPTEEGSEVLVRLLASPASPDIQQWHWGRLLPTPLYSPQSSLFLVELGAPLAGPLRVMFDRTPGDEHVRPFRDDELGADGALEEVLALWRLTLGTLVVREDCPFPDEVLSIWEGALSRGVAVLSALDASDADADIPDVPAAELDPSRSSSPAPSAPPAPASRVSKFAMGAVQHLTSLLSDAALDFVYDPARDEPQAGALPTPTDASPAKPPSKSKPAAAEEPWRSNEAVKLSLSRTLWASACAHLPPAVLAPAARALAEFLMRQEPNLVPPGDTDARAEWSALCAAALARAPTSMLRLFWGLPRTGAAAASKGEAKEEWVWGWDDAVREAAFVAFANAFVDAAPVLTPGDDASARGAGAQHWRRVLSLLGAPFGGAGWEMGARALGAWEGALDGVLGGVRDGARGARVLGTLAARIARVHVVAPGGMAVRVCDALLARLPDPEEDGEVEADADAEEEADGEAAVYALVGETLAHAYPPPGAEDAQAGAWLVRTLASRVDHVRGPARLARLLHTVAAPLAVWLADADGMYGEAEHAFDMLGALETVLFAARALDASRETAVLLAPLARAGRIREEGRAAVDEFWAGKFAEADFDMEEVGWLGHTEGDVEEVEEVETTHQMDVDAEADELSGAETAKVETGDAVMIELPEEDDEASEIEEVEDVLGPEEEEGVDEDEAPATPVRLPVTPMQQPVSPVRLPATPTAAPRPITPPLVPHTLEALPRTPDRTLRRSTGTILLSSARSPSSSARPTAPQTPPRHATTSRLATPAAAPAPTRVSTPRLSTPRLAASAQTHTPRVTQTTSLPARLALPPASPSPAAPVTRGAKRRASETFDAPPPAKRTRSRAGGIEARLLPSPSFAAGKSPFGRTPSNTAAALPRRAVSPSPLGRTNTATTLPARSPSPTPIPRSATSVVRRQRSLQVEVVLTPLSARRVRSLPVRPSAPPADDSGDDDESDSPSPLRALGALPALASDDSIMHPATPRRAAPSSDAEPITARGVLSPHMRLRRGGARTRSLSALAAQSDDENRAPGSDDAPSPSSERAARRLARSSSEGGAAGWAMRAGAGRERAVVLPAARGARSRVLRPARVLAGLPDDADGE